MEINLKFMRAEIGIVILIGVATFWGFLMLTVRGWLSLLAWASLFTGWRIVFSPFALCSFVGMVLYVSDRKGFLIRRSGNELIAVLPAILGLALIFESGFEGLFIFYLMSWGGGPPSWEAWIFCAFDGLAFLSGLLLFFDHWKMREDKKLYPPSPQRLDVETETKYPRALFAKYALQYPHNPEGVLEWHIHKKMKEGKTREQVITELRNIGDRSI